MKTSIILLIAIFLNTTLLLSDPLSAFVRELNIWVLLAIDVVLIRSYYLHKTVKELRRACELELGDLNLFVFESIKQKVQNGEAVNIRNHTCCQPNMVLR